MSAKNRGSGSKSQDRYPSPYPLPAALATALATSWRRPPPTSILEPGCGRAPYCDALCEAFPSICHSVGVDTRLYDIDGRHQFVQADYLTWKTRRRFDLIVTNPPFSLTREFMVRSIGLLKPGGLCCFLQRVNFLGAIERVGLWFGEVNLRHVSVIIPRPSFVKGKSDATEYCWLFFDGYDESREPPTISWFGWDKPQRRSVRRQKNDLH